jgi:hypothetical protein
VLSFAGKSYKLMTPKTLSVIHLKVGLSCCKLLLGIKLLPYMTTPDLPSYLTRAWMTVYDFLMVVVAHNFFLHVNYSWLLMPNPGGRGFSALAVCRPLFTLNKRERLKQAING